MTREELAFRLREVADALDTDPEMQERGLVSLVAFAPKGILQCRYTGAGLSAADYFMAIGAVSIARDALSNDMALGEPMEKPGEGG